MDGARLLDLNPALDVGALAAAFARHRRLQVRDVLTEASARIVHRILAAETPWGLAWQAGARGPDGIRADALEAMAPAELDARSEATVASMRARDYAFSYAQYPMLKAYRDKWDPDGPHDMLLEYLNDRPVLDFVRAVTGMPELRRADAQATLFCPTQFLAVHDDLGADKDRRVAYVLNLCAEDWRPDWGGYLNFYDADGDVVAGFRPRWNALNLFTVPQRHNVTYVPPFAPIARYAITGWFRNR
ncbi:MAG: 2OG-Fe(II) oxygenase [Deltaproteobacteria bacterium]|nr:2OG-Fe(II) oxygenase [Deltaproteobacteria bacterium]